MRFFIFFLCFTTCFLSSCFSRGNSTTESTSLYSFDSRGIKLIDLNDKDTQIQIVNTFGSDSDIHHLWYGKNVSYLLFEDASEKFNSNTTFLECLHSHNREIVVLNFSPKFFAVFPKIKTDDKDKFNKSIILGKFIDLLFELSNDKTILQNEQNEFCFAGADLPNIFNYFVITTNRNKLKFPLLTINEESSGIHSSDDFGSQFRFSARIRLDKNSDPNVFKQLYDAISSWKKQCQ